MSSASGRAPSIFLIAAEESGDVLGAGLARALRERYGGGMALAGVGGRAMAAVGIASLFPIAELSIFGLTEIPLRIGTIIRRIRETADAVIAASPAALVIIDSPDFTHRVARRVRARAPEIPIVDYVSPSVWAWRPGRARAMLSYVDCVVAILPFEPAAYVRLGGPPCVYVGHPLIERVADLRPHAGDVERRRADPPLLLVLPGSRTSEIRRLLDTFGAAVANVSARVGPLELVLPTMPHLAAPVREGVARWAVKPRIVLDADEKWRAFRGARAALAASGTVTLELALAGVPTVAAYRVPLIEEIVARLARLHQRLSSVILANLVMGENVVPELLQRDCTPEKLANALVTLLADTPERERQVAAFGRLEEIMMAGNASPSDKAAAIVLDIARAGSRGTAAPDRG